MKAGKPIAFGVNKVRFVRNRSYFKCSCHAEMDLINKIGNRAKGAVLYLYRFNNTKNPTAREAKNAKPCALCQHILKNAGVSKVYFVDDNQNMQILKNRDMVEIDGCPAYITSQFIDNEFGSVKFKVSKFLKRK